MAGLQPDTPEQERILALIMAADHQRLPVIDALIAAGTPVDGVDTTWGRHPLRTAAANGRPAAVRRLLAHGADPALRDPEGRTPLDLCRSGPEPARSTPEVHDEVEALLAGPTSDFLTAIVRTGYCSAIEAAPTFSRSPR